MIRNLQQAFSRIRSALVRRGRSEQDADDLLQEAWMRLAQYERDGPVDRPEAFLMRTAINLSIDIYRAQARRGEEVLLDDVVLVDTSPSAETVLLAQERMARLSECLGRLPDRTREIFLAHRVEGQTYRAIAEQYKLSISTIEKHVAKATFQLATWMEGW